jgi:RES domain-containing protein
VAAAFDGRGGALNPGRWNMLGTPVVYTAESRSLASLEILVHAEDTSLLSAIRWRVVPVEIDESLIHIPQTLPRSWWRIPAVSATRRFGTDWAKQARTPVLRVPSAVTRGEFNYLLNPRHPEFDRLRIGKPLPFSFDRAL